MRVLIADDERDTTTTLAWLVRSWGFEPVPAHDGKTALELLQGPDAPRLAILDCVMPGINGFDICRQLRQASDRPYTYCLLVTGRASKQDMLQGLEVGADDYLIKPVDPNELCARLRAGQRIMCLQEQLLSSQHALRLQAAHDSLTGLWNRATILEMLSAELERSGREKHPLSILMADIDYFKMINDTFGHLAGDQVLRQTAARLLAALRPYDGIGRYGGEEFLIILPGCDDSAAMSLAERLRRYVAEELMQDESRDIAVTVSLGVAGWDGKLPLAALLRWADAALYRAKRTGRNCVVSAAPVPKPMLKLCSARGSGSQS